MAAFRGGLRAARDGGDRAVARAHTRPDTRENTKTSFIRASFFPRPQTVGTMNKLNYSAALYTGTSSLTTPVSTPKQASQTRCSRSLLLPGTTDFCARHSLHTVSRQKPQTF
jgi:hypothetical protein